MSAPYSATSVSNYNINPPSDDGSTAASNRLQWSNHINKIGNPLKTAFDTSETATAAAFLKVIGGGGFLNTAVDYTVLAADQGKCIRVTVSGKTVTTPDATQVNSPFVFGVRNASSGTVTVAGNNPGLQQTVDGNNSIVIQPGTGSIIGTDGTNWFSFGADFTRPFPPPASFKNLAIKVATNTTVTLVADFIVVTDGSGSFQTLAYNQTINLGTTGANALDTGTIAIDSWYAIWAIAKPDGTLAGLASLSATAPTMPSGYTFKARVGWVRTIHASATLYGTWQLGKRAQYVVGLAQTSVLPSITTAVPVTFTAQSVSNFVPTTATVIRMIFTGTPNTTGTYFFAPNNSYNTNGFGGYDFVSTTTVVSKVIDFMLESTNIYIGGANWTSVNLMSAGWDDSL